MVIIISHLIDVANTLTQIIGLPTTLSRGTVWKISDDKLRRAWGRTRRIENGSAPNPLLVPNPVDGSPNMACM